MFSSGDNKIETRATNGYLETADIEEILNISRCTVYSLFRTGKLHSDSASYVGSRPRKKLDLEEFKRFLKSNPKYYARVYGEVIQKEEPEKKSVEPKTNTESDILTELFDKMESNEVLIKKHEDELVKLNAQKEALEQVIYNSAVCFS